MKKPLLQKGSAGVPPAVSCILQDTSPGRAMRPRSADLSLQAAKAGRMPALPWRRCFFIDHAFANGLFGMPLPRERHLDCDAKRIWHGMSKAKAKKSLPGEEASLSSPITLNK